MIIMKPIDENLLQKLLKNAGNGNTIVLGDNVAYKYVENEIGNIEPGGIGIQINYGDKKEDALAGDNKHPVDKCLTSPVAMKYWKRLEELGFVGSDCQLLPETSRKQAMYIADAFSDKLKLKVKWKPFEQLWGISNLAQEKYKMIETGTAPRRQKDIAKVFED